MTSPARSAKPDEAADFAAATFSRGGTVQAIPTPEEETRKRFRLRALSVAEIRAAETPHWLVRDCLQERTLALVWGASGSGKTFFVLDLAFAMNLGQRWFNRRVKRAGVIYLAGEGHLKSRIEASIQHRGLENADLEGFRAVSASLNLLDPAADIAPLLASLQDASREMGGVALVVLDTLNAAMAGGDENSSEDMGRMILACRQIMAALDCAVMIVHHCGKNERDARGHSSLRAAVDTEIVVREQDGMRVVTIEKQRDGEAGAEIAFRLLPVDLGASTDPDADPDERQVSCVVEPIDGLPEVKGRASKLPGGSETAMRALREVLSDHGQAAAATSMIPPGTVAVHGDFWRARYFALDSADADNTDPAAIAKAKDARLKRFTRARKGLQDAGIIGASNDLFWIYK